MKASCFPTFPTCINHVFIDKEVTHPQPPYRSKVEQVIDQSEMSRDGSRNEPGDSAKRADSKARIDLSRSVIVEMS